MNPSPLPLLLIAVAAGALLGPGDLLAQRALPYPWALWAPTTVFWLALAVVAGATFGTSGGWSTDQAGWRRSLGAALPTAVLLAEAGLLATRPDNGDAAYRTDSLQTAAIEVALAVLCLLIAARDARQRVQALAMALPLAAMALVAFRLVGFGL